MKEAREGYGSGMEGEGGGEPANHPAFPATMRGDGSAPVGGIGTYTMLLDWSITGSSLLSQATTAMAPVTYFWEVYDISGAVGQSVAGPEGEELSPQAKLEQATATVAKKRLLKEDSAEGERVDPGEAGAAEFGVTERRKKEEKKKAAEEFDVALKERNVGDIALGLLNADPTLTAVSDVFRLGADAVGYLSDVAGGYSQERGIPWSRTGVFAVRCVAQPRRLEFDDGSVIRRPPSIAVKVVQVKTLEDLTADKQTEIEADDELKRLVQNMLDATEDPEERESLAKSLADIELRTTAGADKVIEAAIAKKKQDLAEAEASGNPFRIRDEKNALEVLEKQLKLTKRLKGDEVIVRPRATLVSDLTGQSYPLLLQMQIKASDDVFKATISDVTTKDGALYTGKGADPSKAAWNAARAMAADNSYGDGRIVFVMPSTGDPAIDPRSQTFSNAPGTGPQIIRKLEDMGKALAALALLVPGAGEVAMVIGAGVAANRLARKIAEDRLYPDADTALDIISVLSAAAVGVGAAARFKPVRLADGRLGIALTEGGMVAQRAADAAEALNYAGMVITTEKMMTDLKDLSRRELSGDISHAEARKLRLSMAADLAKQTGLSIASAAKARKLRAPEESHPSGGAKQKLDEPGPTAKSTPDAAETPTKTKPSAGEKVPATDKKIEAARVTPEEHPAHVDAGPFKKPAPGENVFEGISDGTKKMLKENPDLADALEQNPRAAKAMKLCGSDCFPKHATPDQIRRMETILADAEANGIQIANGRALRELMHGTKNVQELAIAISAVEARVRSKIADVTAKKGGAVPAGPDPSVREQVLADQAEAAGQGVRTEKADTGEVAPKGSVVIPRQFSNVKLSHDAGVEGGMQQAAKHGIKVDDWNNPQQHIGLYGQGIDAVGKPPGGAPGKVILEWKGEGSPLSPGQMTPEWVGSRIAILKNLGDPMADTLLDAAKKGQLTGRTYRTRIGEGGELIPRQEGPVRRYGWKRIEKAFNERLKLEQARTAAKAEKARKKGI